jgi:formylglycine-generating enzyme required for sulfatase activity
MRFMLIPAGTFRMGSVFDEPMRSEDERVICPETIPVWPETIPVTIDRPFYLGVFPVTQKEYETVMRTNPSHFTKKNGGGRDHPVEQVSWVDAAAFCDRLSGLAVEKKAARVYRLPTEAEWEYACRAGSTTPFAFGVSLSSSQANFDGTKPYGGGAAGPFRQATTKAGLFAPNAWGLYDLHGNVWEWCADEYELCLSRVVRGGSWNNSGHLCRSAKRHKYAPNYRGDNVGFRVALEVG